MKKAFLLDTSTSQINISKLHHETIEKDDQKRTSSDKDYYFQDGKRRIDFILVYLKKTGDVAQEESRAIVNSFLNKMAALGLQFELQASAINDKMIFIKVHTPLSVIYYHARVLGISLERDSANIEYHTNSKARKELTKASMEEGTRVSGSSIWLARPKHATTCERILLTHKIMNSLEDGVGYQVLLASNHLYAAYPLHDGSYEWSDNEKLNDRQLLDKYWADMRMLFKRQPLDLVNRYFGPSIAFYFTWVGFYIKALSMIFIFGLVTTVYGIVTAFTNLNMRTIDFCKSKIILCAKCPHFDKCAFSFVNYSCSSSRITYILENNSVIINAILLSIWATVYFVFWRRYEVTCCYRWNVLELNDKDAYRADYSRRTKYRRLNKLTQEIEPYIPQKIAIIRRSIASLIVAFMIFLVLLVLLGITSFRVYGWRSDHALNKMMIGSVITVIFIIIFEMVFEIVAMQIMKFLNPKTNTDFDKELILHLFTFGFVNGFFPLIYVSFVKNHVYAHPGLSYSSFGAMITTDTCEADDCLLDIAFQLNFILFSTCILRTCREIFGPLVYSWHKRRNGIPLKARVPVWEEDLYKSSFQRFNLVFSYKHLMLQFGYITLYAAVFPLSPLCALVYNIVELRLDARKLVRWFRRPISYRSSGIGAWNTILRVLALVSVITNTLIIAFTTEFVERIIDSVNNELRPLERTLSKFALEDYHGWEQNKHKTRFPNLTECYYFSQRFPPESKLKYLVRFERMFTVALQLMAFILLEHVILGIMTVVEMIIPKTPGRLHGQLQKERIKDIEEKEIVAETEHWFT